MQCKTGSLVCGREAAASKEDHDERELGYLLPGEMLEAGELLSMTWTLNGSSDPLGILEGYNSGKSLVIEARATITVSYGTKGGDGYWHLHPHRSP